VSDAPRDPNRLHLVVLTPEEILFQGAVLWAQVPLIDGMVGVWPGHAPLIGRIDQGIVEYATSTGTEKLAVASGVLRVDEERCIVLVGALAEGEPGGWSADGAGMEALETDGELEAIVEGVLAYADDPLRGLRDE
jgi:hypothetical protein